MIRLLCAVLALALLSGPARADSDAPADGLHETVLSIPMAPLGVDAALVATSYRPDGNGRFPLIILTHGNPPDASDRPQVGRYRIIPQIRSFVDRGYAVLVVVRRGYGATGGSFAEGYGTCTADHYIAAGQQAAKDVAAAVRFAGSLPYVDRTKIVLMGQSAGGFAVVAAASLDLPGVVGVLNFSGGRGGDPSKHPGIPCGDTALAETYRHFAATIKVPVLWHYVENDHFFGPDYTRAWFKAFVEGGGHGFYVLEPPYGKDGHGMLSNAAAIHLWMPRVATFLQQLGLPS